MVLAICLFLLNSSLLVFIYWLSRGLKISGFEHDPISGAEENVLSLPSLGMRQHGALPHRSSALRNCSTAVLAQGG